MPMYFIQFHIEPFTFNTGGRLYTRNQKGGSEQQQGYSLKRHESHLHSYSFTGFQLIFLLASYRIDWRF
jgi:hypothetical protein